MSLWLWQLTTLDCNIWYTLQRTSKILFPGSEKSGEKVAFCLPTSGRQTHFFHHIFSQPGKSLLEVPCIIRKGLFSERDQKSKRNFYYNKPLVCDEPAIFYFTCRFKYLWLCDWTRYSIFRQWCQWWDKKYTAKLRCVSIIMSCHECTLLYLAPTNR